MTSSDSGPEYDEPKWIHYLDACTRWCENAMFSENDLVFSGTDWARVEHSVHELSHSALLHAGGGLRLSTAVSIIISGMPLKQQLDQERDTWAVEYIVAQRLGLPLEVGDVIEGASVQGVDDDEMQSALDRLDEYEGYADVVMRHLDRWKDYYARSPAA